MNFFMILSCKTSFLDVFVAKGSSIVKKKIQPLWFNMGGEKERALCWTRFDR